MSRRFMVGNAPKRVEPTDESGAHGHYGVEHQRPGGVSLRTGLELPNLFVERTIPCSFKGQLTPRWPALVPRSSRRSLSEWCSRQRKSSDDVHMERGPSKLSGSPPTSEPANYENCRPRLIRNGHIRTGQREGSGSPALRAPSYRVGKRGARWRFHRAWSGGRSAPDQSAFDVHGSGGALQNGSDTGSPSGRSPTAHRYALPEEM